MMKNLIYELELSLLKPETRRSPTQLNQLIADDFVEFGSSGNIYHKKDCVDQLFLTKFCMCSKGIDPHNHIAFMRTGR